MEIPFKIKTFLQKLMGIERVTVTEIMFIQFCCKRLSIVQQEVDEHCPN